MNRLKPFFLSLLLVLLVLTSCSSLKPATSLSLSIHFIDVGQGDSILIDLGQTEVLIDGGEKSPGVVNYLRNHIDGPLEVMIATHPHDDHIGGLIEVLERFEVKEIWWNGDNSSSKTFSDFMNLVYAEKAIIYEAERGKLIKTGALTFTVLNPNKPLSNDSNKNSIVVNLVYGNVDFLFMGDADRQAESSMLGLVPDVDVLKVGHHGSQYSSSPAFLAIAKPEVAIYSAGKGNVYGHPDVETINNLKQIGAKIYGTDTSGTIIITTNGKVYSVKTDK
jgi:competence protein ComEC